MSKRGNLLESTAKSTIRAVYSRSMALPPERDHCPQFSARVTAVTDLTPAFRRVTITASEISDVALMGPDEYVGLFMPPPGQGLQMPDYAGLNPRSTLSRIPEASRPDLRWYTVREHRAALAEIDIDIVSRGHDGPGARWITRVKPGDPVGLRFQTAPYGSAPDVGHHVLIADETGLPGVLESSPLTNRTPSCASVRSSRCRARTMSCRVRAKPASPSCAAVETTPVLRSPLNSASSSWAGSTTDGCVPRPRLPRSDGASWSRNAMSPAVR